MEQEHPPYKTLGVWNGRQVLERTITTPVRPPPSPEVAAVVYAIADIMAAAPKDATGNRMMEVEAIVKELVGLGIPTATARDGLSWAWGRDLVRRANRAGEYPEIVKDTITLRQVGNGEWEWLLGVRQPVPPKHKRRLKPLTDAHQEAYNLICESSKRGEGLTGPQICRRLGIDSESNFTAHYVPELKRHGIRNRRGLGYYHPDFYTPTLGGKR